MFRCRTVDRSTYVFMFQLMRESYAINFGWYDYQVMRVGTNNLYQYFSMRQDIPNYFATTTTSWKSWYDGRKFFTYQRSSSDCCEGYGPYFPSLNTGSWHQIGIPIR